MARHLTLNFTIDGSYFTAEDNLIKPPDPENYAELINKIAQLMPEPVMKGTTIDVPLNKTGKFPTLLDYIQVFKELRPGQVGFRKRCEKRLMVEDAELEYIEYLVDDSAAEANRGNGDASTASQEAEEDGLSTNSWKVD